MIIAYVKGQALTIAQPLVVADTIDYLTMQVHFQTSDWAGRSVWASFFNGETRWTIGLHDGQIKAQDHLNLTAGDWSVYLYGTAPDGSRITTQQQTVTVEKTGTNGGAPAPDVPLSQAEQIDQKATAAQQAAQAVRDDADQGKFNGGYYTATVTAQGTTATITFQPSKPGMAEIPPQTITLPTAGVGPEEIDQAVKDYLEKNPIEAPVVSVNGQTGAVTIDVPTKTSQLTNDSGFVGGAEAQTIRDSVAAAEQSAETAKNTAESVRNDANAGKFKGDPGPAGKDGLPGPTGQDGPRGADGLPGKDGVTPKISIGTVSTLVPGAKATAEITGPVEDLKLNLGIPQGPQGEPGQGDGSGTDIGLGVQNATVGQIIEVEQVDESGKPIKWKAVDKPSGGGSGGGPANASQLPATVPEQLPPETAENVQAVLDALAAKPSGGGSTPRMEKVWHYEGDGVSTSVVQEFDDKDGIYVCRICSKDSNPNPPDSEQINAELNIGNWLRPPYLAIGYVDKQIYNYRGTVSVIAIKNHQASVLAWWGTDGMRQRESQLSLLKMSPNYDYCGGKVPAVFSIRLTSVAKPWLIVDVYRVI